MDVPKGYITTIKVPVPTDVTATITVTKDGTSLPPFTVSSSGLLLSIPLPYAATHHEGTAEVAAAFQVEGQNFARVEKVNVVTPYIEIHEVKQILGATATQDECFEAEAAARQVINAHTGQEFGYFEGTLDVMSNYNEALPLPRKTIRVDKITALTVDLFDRTHPTSGTTYLGQNQFEITGSGWYLKRPVWSSSLIVGDVYSNDPIEAPSYTGLRKFDNDVTYTITGAFGYETVPTPVRQAAQLLTEQYACADREYREQYLESIKSADWRIQFNSGAYRRTGNARADKLLSPFVVNRAKVI